MVKPRRLEFDPGPGDAQDVPAANPMSQDEVERSEVPVPQPFVDPGVVSADSVADDDVPVLESEDVVPMPDPQELKDCNPAASLPLDDIQPSVQSQFHSVIPARAELGVSRES